MHKTLSTVLASLLLATSAIGTGAVAESRYQSRFYQQDRFVQDYCSNHYDRSCRDWDRNHSSWNETHYQRWYSDHSRRNDFRADNALAGIFGFAAGVITGATGGNMHVTACENRFRSYDRGSDSYLGFDGRRHACRL